LIEIKEIIDNHYYTADFIVPAAADATAATVVKQKSSVLLGKRSFKEIEQHT
jgi:hypothetical protein